MNIWRELRRILRHSSIIQSKQHRLKTLVEDITSNRHYVQSIFTRLDDVQDILFTLKQFVKEEIVIGRTIYKS